MKIRVAEKVLLNRGGLSYRPDTYKRALRRNDQHGKGSWRWWRSLMESLGPLGRADLRFGFRLEDECKGHGIKKQQTSNCGKAAEKGGE